MRDTIKSTVMANALTFRLSPKDSPAEVTLRILDILRQRNECTMDELLQTCAPYTWNVVFLEVDRLSRSGHVRLLYRKDGAYAVRLPHAA